MSYKVIIESPDQEEIILFRTDERIVSEGAKLGAESLLSIFYEELELEDGYKIRIKKREKISTKQIPKYQGSSYRVLIESRDQEGLELISTDDRTVSEGAKLGAESLLSIFYDELELEDGYKIIIKSKESKTMTENKNTKRSHLLTIQLSCYFGLLGFDRYYLGKIGTGILKMITLGGFGIWYLADIFLVLYNKQTDVDGQSLEGQDKRNPVMLTALSLVSLDRFYLGQTFLGILKIITFGGMGFWYLIDIYLCVSGKMIDSNGRPIEHDEKRYQSVTLIFAVLLGIFGFDRFYLGHRSLGMMKLFTFTFGLWVILDIVLTILNATKDVNGNSLVQE